MKWVQINDLGLTHTFALEGDESTTINLVGDIDKVKRKLRSIFGVNVEIVTFEDDMDQLVRVLQRAKLLEENLKSKGYENKGGRIKL